MSKETNSAVLRQCRTRNASLEAEIERLQGVTRQDKTKIRKLKAEVENLQAQLKRERELFQTRQLEWFGMKFEDVKPETFEPTEKPEDEQITETLTGARVILSPISDSPYVSTYRGREVICMRAISKMDIVGGHFEPEIGSPKHNRGNWLYQDAPSKSIEEIREALK